MLFSYLTLAEVTFDFSALANGKIKVVIQGISGGNYQVNFYKKHKNDSDKGDFVDQKNSNSGGLSHVVNTTFKYDEQVTVSILNYKGNGQHLNQVSRTYGNLSGQNPPPTYTPTPTPTVQPTPNISQAKIREYADQQARTVANRVVKTYGERENFRYNFVQGLWKGYNDYRAYDNSNRYGFGEYQRGYRLGSNEGDRNGTRSGLNDAASSGQSAGANDARSRFIRALDNQAQLNTTLGQVNAPYFAGSVVSGGYQQPSLQQKIQELEDDFRVRVCRPYSFDHDGYTLGCEWTLSDAYRYNGTYTFIDSWFRADYAFSEWRNNGLGGRYDYNLYNQMGSEQRETFARYFKATYEQVIDEKFNRVKYQPNRQVQELGYSYGIMLGKEMAYQQGLYDGYRISFVPASIRSFNLAYVAEYKKGFDARVAYHSRQPVLENFEAYLTGNFIPGGKFDLVITKVVNLGLVDAAREGVRVSGNSISSLPVSDTLTVPALTSMKKNVVFKNVASISYNVPSNQTQSVSISFASINTSSTFVVSWEKILSNFIATNSADPNFKMSLDYVHKQLENELATARAQKNNIYEAGLQSDTLLSKAVGVYRSANTQGKQNLSQVSDLSPNGLTLCEIANDVSLLQIKLKKIRKSFVLVYKNLDNNCNY